jgi:hypothetical protein
METSKKIALAHHDSNGAKKGRTIVGRRVWRTTKRGARAAADRLAARDAR